MATPLVSTKIYIPTPRKGSIARPKLIDRLNGGRERKLILVSAPAGYGKTSLLTEWVSQLGAPVGWISLDEQDNDPKRFFSYLSACLKRAGVQINENSFPNINAPDPATLSGFLTILINQVAALSQPVFLVLDDFHRANNPKINRVITQLLDNVPANLHLVIATRSDPLLQLAKLRGQAELLEIRANDLRFTSEETAQYLNSSLKLGVSVEDIKVLTAKTEGWIVGLQLAAISLHNNPDQQGFIRRFAGDDRFIADYLLDEALNHQAEKIQNFLLETSILDLLTVPLCDAVTGRNDSLDILSELLQANLFLVSLDDKGDWYRYHHLFADYLRKRLNQNPIDLRRRLYRRASEWFEQNQLLSEAVRMSLYGEDTARVAELMEGYLLTIVSTSELVEMNQLLSSLPEDKFSEDPWLALASAWGLAYEGDLDQAQMLLKLAATGSEDPDGENRPRLKGRILVLQAYLAGSGADYPQSVLFAREALKELPESDLSIRSFTILIIGNAYRFEGKLKDALHYHQEALQLSERARDTSLSVIILSRLVEIYRITGQVELSCGKGRETLALIEQHQYKIGVTTFIEGYLKLRLSRSYYERNELEQAYQSAETGLELAKQWGAYDSLSLGYFNFCEIYQAMGDAEKAGSYLQEFMQKFPFESRFQYRTALAYQAELALRIGDVQSAEHWAQSSGLQVSDNIPFLLYKFYDVLAQVLIAQKKYADARPLMEKLLRTAVESGAVELEIQARGRMALMLMEAGDEKSALEIFTPALNLAAAGKYMRTILDLGDEIAQGILIAAKKGIQVAYCSDLLENIQPAKTAGCAERQVLIEPLSSRENDVLGLIALGYSNQEIAEELTLSLYTIKSHARNIFSKLGVKNRTEAVARARRLGVLPQE